MFKAGQEVYTKYGVGVVLCASKYKPQLYVHVRSNSHIYVLDESSVTTVDESRSQADYTGQAIDLTTIQDQHPMRARENSAAASSGFSEDDRDFEFSRRPLMRRMQIGEQTPLATFVRERLTDLGMRQSDFCRLTGFDQGLLSKIQSSTITNLSLESVLKLADGLTVSPKKILKLIGRMDLHDLVMRSYSTELDKLPSIDEMGTPTPVLEISQLALRAHQTGCSLDPVVKLLYPLAIGQARLIRKSEAGKTQ